MNEITPQEREAARQWCDQYVLGKFESSSEGVLLLPSTEHGHPGTAMAELFDRVAKGMREIRIPAAQPTYPKWRHRRTGGVYLLISDNVTRESDLIRCVLYQSVDDGQKWMRPYNEFFDGRFELLINETQR